MLDSSEYFTLNYNLQLVYGHMQNIEKLLDFICNQQVLYRIYVASTKEFLCFMNN